MKSAFTFKYDEFDYRKTRRGIAATCPFRKDGVLAGTLNDLPEKIVADVTFTSPQFKEEFLAEARSNKEIKWPSKDRGPSDSYLISEHARLLSMEEEARFAKEMEEQQKKGP